MPTPPRCLWCHVPRVLSERVILGGQSANGTCGLPYAPRSCVRHRHFRLLDRTLYLAAPLSTRYPFCLAVKKKALVFVRHKKRSNRSNSNSRCIIVRAEEYVRLRSISPQPGQAVTARKGGASVVEPTRPQGSLLTSSWLGTWKSSECSFSISSSCASCRRIRSLGAFH